MNAFLAKYPLDPTGKSRFHQRLLLALTACALICAAVCLGLMSLFFACLYLVKARFYTYFSFPALVVLNVAPVVVLVLLLWILTNRPALSFLLSSALVIVATYGNYFKVALRDDPFIAEDLTTLGEAANMVGNYTIDLSGYFTRGIVLCLLGTLFLLLVARGRFTSSRVRFLGMSAILALSLFSYRTWYTSDTLYDSFENYTYFNAWVPAEKYASHGFIYPFLHSIPAAISQPPAGYSSANAQQILSRYPDAEIPADKKVNLICVQLESFSDLSKLPGVEFEQDPYAPWHALEQESYSGTLISDTFGGGTSNAERSFLTGFLYPHTSYRHKTESFAWYLASQGYQCVGAHPGHDWFYNRKNVMENFGFVRYDFLENYFAARFGDDYTPDAELFPALREQYLEDTADGTPCFSFDISYQGHSPFSEDTLAWGENYLSHDGLTDAQYYSANSYLGGIADTVQQVSAFIDSFRDDDTPVVIALYGDHKAKLCPELSVYPSLGVNTDTETWDGFLNYYSTSYLIWANDAAKAVLGNDFTGEGPTVGPYHLMSVIFDLCGWEGSSMLQLSRATRETLPVLHSTGVYWTPDGTLNSTPPDEDAAQALEIAQYYLRNRRKS